MALFATNIQWSRDDNDWECPIALPSKIMIPSYIKKDDDYDDAISDYISDKTGFCHAGFQLETIDDTKRFAQAEKLVSDVDNEIYYKCPFCGEFIIYQRQIDEYKNKLPNHCPDCGQLFDWSDIMIDKAEFVKQYMIEKASVSDLEYFLDCPVTDEIIEYKEDKIDEILSQMPDEELTKFYNKFCDPF